MAVTSSYKFAELGTNQRCQDIDMQKCFRLRYLLPVAQMALGVALLVWSNAWMLAIIKRIHGTVQTTPPFTFLISLNYPAALARDLWFRHVPSPWEDRLLIPAIGLLWYWVARNIESWRQVKRLLRAPHLAIQLTIDLLQVALGVLIGFMVFAEVSRYLFLWEIVTESTLGFMWCFALIIFPGWDLVELLRSIAGDKSPYRK